jgi:hypothetical protein
VARRWPYLSVGPPPFPLKRVDNEQSRPCERLSWSLAWSFNGEVGSRHAVVAVAVVVVGDADASVTMDGVYDPAPVWGSAIIRAKSNA